MDTANGSNAPGTRLPSQRLNTRQASMLAFIQDYTARQPYPPILRETAEGCNLSGSPVPSCSLRFLDRRKCLTPLPGAARGIVLTPQGWSWSPAPEDGR